MTILVYPGMDFGKQSTAAVESIFQWNQHCDVDDILISCLEQVYECSFLVGMQ